MLCFDQRPKSLHSRQLSPARASGPPRVQWRAGACVAKPAPQHALAPRSPSNAQRKRQAANSMRKPERSRLEASHQARRPGVPAWRSPSAARVVIHNETRGPFGSRTWFLRASLQANEPADSPRGHGPVARHGSRSARTSQCRPKPARSQSIKVRPQKSEFPKQQRSRGTRVSCERRTRRAGTDRGGAPANNARGVGSRSHRHDAGNAKK